MRSAIVSRPEAVAREAGAAPVWSGHALPATTSLWLRKLARLAPSALAGLFCAGSALAEPPPDAVAGSPAAVWFGALTDRRGIGCCSIADCRHAQLEVVDGRVLAFIDRATFGPSAPDGWLEIPPAELRSRGDRPASVSGAIVCFYSGKIACADLEGAG